MRELLKAVLSTLDINFNLEESLQFELSSLNDLNSLAGNHSADSLVAIECDKTHMGSDLLLDIALRQAKRLGHMDKDDPSQIHYINCELTDISFGQRLLSKIARLDIDALSMGTLQYDEWTKLGKAVTELKDLRMIAHHYRPIRHLKHLRDQMYRPYMDNADAVFIQNIDSISGTGTNYYDTVEMLNDWRVLYGIPVFISYTASSARPLMSHVDLCISVNSNIDSFPEKIPNGKCRLTIARNSCGCIGNVDVVYFSQYCGFGGLHDG